MVSSNPPPLVFVFDLDGTIVGDVSALICEWQILKAFNIKDGIKTYKRAIQDSFDAGIVRPYFPRLLHAVNSLPHKYMFVYTASEGKWARFLCKNIEKHYNVKFEHVFTRAHCIKNNDTFELSKSILRIYPSITKLLQQKYNVTPSKDFRKHIVMIDNNYVLPDQERTILLKCPSYTHDVAYDVLRFVPLTIVNRHYLDIASMLLGYNIFPAKYHRSNYNQNGFWTLYFNHIADRVKALSKQSTSIVDEDMFFKALARAVRAMSKHPSMLTQTPTPALALQAALRHSTM